ncbi:hypothetical protein F8E02_03375 [Methanoculleus sp. Wushi-C6]|uniref:Uncharacterized protein n=1 Tax=Methanoculleus caldifontis TaxID=2651577 RepID=A0ABU3WZ38_9EURY|nr:hypothetical protein [Methanoculleus sp. Wushi-C6]MDV2481064.1 hypothetical protein [Methanoculleus sp. Wushi-C6]
MDDTGVGIIGGSWVARGILTGNLPERVITSGASPAIEIAGRHRRSDLRASTVSSCFIPRQYRLDELLEGR